jgi:hypothetical protein
MRVWLRRGIVNCSVWLSVAGSIARRDRTIRRDWSRIPVANTSGGRGDASVRRHAPHGQSDGWRHVDGGAPAMRVPQGSRRPRSPSARGSASRRRCSWRRFAAFALARTAGRTQLDATVMRRAKLSKVHPLLERRGFLARLCRAVDARVPAASLHDVAGVAAVGVPARAAAMVPGALASIPHESAGSALWRVGGWVAGRGWCERGAAALSAWVDAALSARARPCSGSRRWRRSIDWSSWRRRRRSAGRRQCAEAGERGEQRVGPGPVGGQVQGPAAAGACQPARDVQEAVA